MTAFAGQIAFAQPLAINPPSISAQLNQYSDMFGAPDAVTFGRPFAAPSAQVLPSFTGLPVGSVLHKSAGREWFDKVIVTPREKDLGFVLSQIVFAVDVWNTSDALARRLQAISIQGGGGTVVADPFGTPLQYAPMQSRSYELTVPQAGISTIEDIVTWTFVGIDGTNLTITGSRLTLFSVDPDWEPGIEERAQFLTDIMRAYSDSEQRLQLRKSPRIKLAFRVRTLEKRDTEALDALLWGWQARIYGVPLWTDSQPLLASVSTGDSTVQVDTSQRRFEAGGLVAIWRDQHTWEVQTIDTLDASSLTLLTPLQNDWAADGQTWVIPVLLGRVNPQTNVLSMSNETEEINIEFSCEVV